MIEHEVHIRVRYSETDQMGYCYYGNYAQYYEVGRAELIRSIGLSYKDLEKIHGILMPVMSMKTRFVRPALYDENLRMVTQLKELPQKTMTFHSNIYNEKNKLVNGGYVRLGFINAEKSKSLSAPQFLIEKLSPYFENT